jgi:hypothetical protein
MARQTELLNLLVQAQQNQHRQQSRGGRDDPHPQLANYQDFLGTQPPLFHKADEPLDADAWLHTIESKFALLPAPCSRRYLQPNYSVALPASGGIIIMLCSLPVMSSLGMSFGPLFEHTTSPKDSLSESSMNF